MDTLPPLPPDTQTGSDRIYDGRSSAAGDTINTHEWVRRAD
jgi:hypothetical protein